MEKILKEKNIKTLNLAKKIALTGESKKAKDIIVINVKRFTIIADYFVIMTVTSEPHKQTIIDSIIRKIKQDYNIIPLHIDGRIASGWTVLDYGGVMVHIFLKDIREIFNLEKLYNGARKIKFTE